MYIVKTFTNIITLDRVICSKVIRIHYTIYIYIYITRIARYSFSKYRVSQNWLQLVIQIIKRSKKFFHTSRQNSRHPATLHPRNPTSWNRCTIYRDRDSQHRPNARGMWSCALRCSSTPGQRCIWWNRCWNTVECTKASFLCSNKSMASCWASDRSFPVVRCGIPVCGRRSPRDDGGGRKNGGRRMADDPDGRNTRSVSVNHCCKTCPADNRSSRNRGTPCKNPVCRNLVAENDHLRGFKLRLIGLEF